MPAPMNRRTFLQHGSALGSGLVLTPIVSQTPLSAEDSSPLAPEPEPVQTPTTTLRWFDQPLRILQTVMREPDAAEYDAASVVQYMKEAHCNTLVVNAGGIVDFFQNPLPLANINPFMKGRDILREITEACHAEGFRVIGRVDFRGVEEHVFETHPDWFSLDRHGNPLLLNYTQPPLHSSCFTGYYRNEHAEQFIRHLMEHYQLDGIWHNSIGVVGICYCDRCRESYYAFSGRDLPIEGESSTEEIDSYMTWKMQVADAHMDHMKRVVKSYGDDKVYTAEVFNMFEVGHPVNIGIDLYMARDHFDFLVSVAFLTHNTDTIQWEDLHYASTIVKFLKSMAPEKEAVILYGGNGTAHRYVMDPPTDLKVWLWQALSAGGRFWNCNFTGYHPNATYDRRNAFNNTENYRFVAEQSSLLSQHGLYANVGIYYSRPTRILYRNLQGDLDRFDASIQGVELVLNENHIPYAFIADDQLSAEKLASFRVVILPNVKCLNETEMELLREYVNEGGTLLATFETSLYDHAGTKRSDFGLADLFGCHWEGERIDTRKDHYQNILASFHPILNTESDRTSLLINAGETLLCRMGSSGRMLCNYVPRIHNQPPEKAWNEDWLSAHPTLVENRFGEGRVLYFANQPDQTSHQPGHPDMRNLLLRSVRHLVGTALPVRTDAPESVHLGLTRSVVNKKHYLFSMINTTSTPMRPLRRLIPVGRIRTRLQLEGGELQHANVMRAQGECTVQERNGWIEIEMERLEDACFVHIELG